MQDMISKKAADDELGSNEEKDIEAQTQAASAASAAATPIALIGQVEERFQKQEQGLEVLREDLKSKVNYTTPMFALYSEKYNLKYD
jgi:hypothetical protein